MFSLFFFSSFITVVVATLKKGFLLVQVTPVTSAPGTRKVKTPQPSLPL